MSVWQGFAVWTGFEPATPAIWPVLPVLEIHIPVLRDPLARGECWQLLVFPDSCLTYLMCPVICPRPFRYLVYLRLWCFLKPSLWISLRLFWCHDTAYAGIYIYNFGLSAVWKKEVFCVTLFRQDYTGSYRWRSLNSCFLPLFQFSTVERYPVTLLTVITSWHPHSGQIGWPHSGQ